MRGVSNKHCLLTFFIKTVIRLRRCADKFGEIKKSVSGNRSEVGTQNFVWSFFSGKNVILCILKDISSLCAG